MSKEGSESSVNPCIDCPGRCCSENLINLCTYDVWSLMRTLNVPPTDFVGFAEIRDDNQYDVTIDRSGRRYCVVINMREIQDGNRRCIFALNLPEPVVRCGIYTCRPIACRAYPLTFKTNKVTVKPWALCPEKRWNTDRLDLTYWRRELARHGMEFSIHAFLAGKWNEKMKSRPEMPQLNFRAFFEYLFDIYGELEPVRASVSERSWGRIYRNWHRYTQKHINPLDQDAEELNETPDLSVWINNVRNAVAKSLAKNA